MLWQIDGSNTYILGSIHATNIDPLLLQAVAEKAYRESIRTVFETDLDGTPDPLLFLLPGNGQLADLLPQSLFRAARAHWLRLGLPEPRLLSLRPGFAAMTLQFTQAAQAGYLPQLGVDRSIWARARLDGKQRLQLESFSAQLSMLAESALAEQVSLLGHIAGQDDVGLSELSGMVAAWSSGNIGHFESLLVQRMRLWPLTFETLISRRNRNWVPSISAMASDGTPTLVVVGLLHLLGPTGLPELLEQHGLHLVFRDADT